MEEFLKYSLFGSVWVLGVAVLALIIGLFVFEYKGKPISALLAIGIFVGVIAYEGKIPLVEVFSVKYALYYLGIGFLFALLRTFYKGKQLKTKEEKEEFQLKYHIFNWWFLWVISLINLLFSDLLIKLYDFIYKHVESLFLKVFYFGDKK